MSAPKRIQRKRTKGWRMPKGAIYVGRPSKWGNPFAPKIIPGWATLSREYAVEDYRRWLFHHHGTMRRSGEVLCFTCHTAGDTSADKSQRDSILSDISELAGRDLACWCALGQPCHADVLLELANPEPSDTCDYCHEPTDASAICEPCAQWTHEDEAAELAWRGGEK